MNNIPNKFAILIAISLMLHACKTEHSPLDVIRIYPDMQISELPGEMYFIGIRALHLDEVLYAVDSRQDKIFVFDQEGDFLTSMGRHGQGPGEFMGPSQVYGNEKALVVFNEFQQRFDLFRDNKYYNSVPLPEKIGRYIGHKFFMAERVLYFSAPFEDESIVAVCAEDGRVIKRFGEMFNFDSPGHYNLRNFRHILGHKDYIISVSDNIPVIKKYTLEGELVSSFNFGDLEILQERLMLNKENQQQNRYSKIVDDACLHDDRLYVLLTTNAGSSTFKKHVLAISLEDGEMKKEKLYSLGKGWFSAITVSGGYLWAYRDGREDVAILRFNLNEF